MKILAHAYCSDEITCDLALISLSVAEMQARCKIAAAAGSAEGFYAVSFWDASAEFYEGYVELAGMLTPEQAAQFERDGHLIVPDDFVLGDETPMRTDANLVHVTSDGFYWEAQVKHTDLHVETRQLGFALLAGVSC